MGEPYHEPFQWSFNNSLRVDVQGARVTSDGGLMVVRELDERLGCSELLAQHLTDSRRGKKLIRSAKIWAHGAALTSRLPSFETEILAEEEHCAGWAASNRELIARAEAIDSPQRVVLDMDSTEIPVDGRQEQSADHGHFESTGDHPLRLFNRAGDGLAVTLRPGNVPSAEGWEARLVPELERQQEQGQEVAFRADAAFATPEIDDALEARV
jgi:hypothetical protein